MCLLLRTRKGEIDVLSVVIPSYNEEGNVVRAADEVSKLLEDNGIDYELVFVNDGSTDKTWELISGLAQSREHIVGVNFSRNFGKESAIFAGLEVAKGDACVLLDCDLQFPPEVIIEMYDIWKNNDVDIVEGRKKSRGKENFLYKAFSLMFYKMINSSSGLDMRAASDFKLMDRSVVDSLNAMPERLTFFRAMSSWVGYKTEQIYFDVRGIPDGCALRTSGQYQCACDRWIIWPVPLHHALQLSFHAEVGEKDCKGAR